MSKSPQPSSRQPVVLLLLLVLLAVLAVVVYSRRKEIASNFGGPAVAQPRGTGSKAQRDAAKILEKQKILVIIETPDPAYPDDKLVTSINFCGNPEKKTEIDEEVLRQMANFPDLQSLNAADCKITSDQLKYLAGLTKMASLVLSGTSVTDEGLAHLRPLVGIESLHLKDTAVSDAGLDHLAALTNLKVLDLSKTKVTDAGLKKLAAAGEPEVAPAVGDRDHRRRPPAIGRHAEPRPADHHADEGHAGRDRQAQAGQRQAVGRSGRGEEVAVGSARSDQRSFVVRLQAAWRLKADS